MDNSGNNFNNDQNSNWNNDGSQNNNWQTPPPFQRQPIFVDSILDRPVLKNEAKNIFKSSYGTVLAVTILPSIIATLIALIPVVGAVLSWLFSPILLVGSYYVILGIIRGRKMKVGNMFDIFGDFGNVFGAQFTTQLFTTLWSLLFVIPGIYKAYCWAMVPYILADNPTMSGTEARRISNEMMDGHKMELFVLQLSFIGWFILSFITVGIFGFFYVNPWVFTTTADYYDNLKMLYEAQNMQQNQDGWQ